MKRYNCTSSDKRGAFGLCMEEHKEGAFVPFSEISGLAEQLADATRQCGIMADLLREVTKIVPVIGVAIDDLPVVDAFLERVERVLAGKLPDRQDTEWTDATTSPVAADYRELQGQHDQLQSRLKGALDTLKLALPYVEDALERALHQIAQLQASQPAGLSMSTESRAGFRCKSIEREHGRDVYRAQCPYVGISISMKDVK